jgi:MFS family permease
MYERSTEYFDTALRRREESDPETKQGLGSLVVTMTVSQLMFLNVATFLPLYVQEHKNFSLDAGLLSIILSMYQVSRLLLSTWVGHKLPIYGKKRFVIAGFAFLIVSTLGFCALALVNDKWLFFSAALTFRFVQGIGGTFLQVAAQAIALTDMGERTEQSVAAVNAARGLGFLAGPLIGQALYIWTGYVGTFGIFALILSLSLIFVGFKLTEGKSLRR